MVARMASRALVNIAPLRASAPFRRFWASQVLTATGMQMATVAVLFQVWEATKNPFWVAAIGVVQAVPMVVLGLVGGALADVFDRRVVVLWAGAAQVVAGLALGAQVVVGEYPLLVLLALLAAQTSGWALAAPSRRTFTVRLLPRHLVAPGVALTMLAFQAAMLVGPAVGGVMVGATSVGVCYLLNAAAMATSWVVVWSLPPMPPQRGGATDAASGTGERQAARTGRLIRRTRRGLAMVAEGVGLVRRNEVLRGSFLLDLGATLLAFPVALFPMVNDRLFDGDPRTLGLFMSAVAVGGVSAGLMSGAYSSSRRLGRVQLGGVAGWGVTLLGFGVATLAQQPIVALAFLVLAGAADTVSVTSRAAMVQISTPDSHLGRVTALEHIIGVAGPDVGNARAGAVAGVTTPAAAALIGAATCIGVCGWVAATHREVERFTLTVEPSAS